MHPVVPLQLPSHGIELRDPGRAEQGIGGNGLSELATHFPLFCTEGAFIKSKAIVPSMLPAICLT